MHIGLTNRRQLIHPNIEPKKLLKPPDRRVVLNVDDTEVVDVAVVDGIIEKYTENVRFCIICNYLSKIIPALQSRCTRFRFAPLSPTQILPRLNYVIEQEQLVVSEDGKQALLTLANGDMRKVLNVLQSTWLAFKNVTEDNVYTCVGHPLKSDIENIIKWLLNETFKTTYNIIEKYTENVRFCIICNYLSKIIPALQSRCTRFRFAPLSPTQILPRLNYVIEQEQLVVSEDGKQALLTLANGDMRKVLNVLQSTWLAFKNVTEDNVYTCVGHPLKSDIENIIKWLLNETFKTTYNNIKQLQNLKGLALPDILTEVHRYVHRIEFPHNVIITLLDKMAIIEHRLSVGADEGIQLTALVASFQQVKELSPPN
ncbi:hypothetical protein RN001_012986 [Aquatica leii]|uniref:Activator 1 subunit 5 n=1 Tax=Aquatica leii TaxID=1421715 RepID=A0AAN7P1M1_9COLE|nr:hypothetical protein RN001_012986 [Aquatica leii]